MIKRPSEAPYDRDDIAARYGFERHITHAVEQVASSRHTLTQDMLDEYQALINSCYVMKGALFNASQRLERKRSAGQFTFALSGIYGFLVPLFTLQFEPFLTALFTNVVSFTAATAGAISFVIAMIYQQRNLGGQSRGYHTAGLKMNNLRRQLTINPLTHPEQLGAAVHQYDDILMNAQNHDEIDFEYARLGSRPKSDEADRLKSWRKSRRRLNVRFFFHTYGLLAAVWIIPPLIGVLIWFALSGQISTAAPIPR